MTHFHHGKALALRLVTLEKGQLSVDQSKDEQTVVFTMTPFVRFFIYKHVRKKKNFI